jgi:hypothetical protein
MSRYEYAPVTGRYEQVDPPEPPRTGRLDFHRVPLDRQGYTKQGRYFGTGAPLYSWYDDETGKEHFTRASSRDEARREFLKIRSKGAESMRRSRRNPTSDKEHLRNTALVVGGLVVLAGVGYYFYSQSQSSTTAAAGGGGGGSGTLTGPSQTNVLGSGGSSSALGPAASSSNDFEAGSGTDAPLIPTASS